MSNRFSFSAADDLIGLLTMANAHLREKNQQLGGLTRSMAEAFRDEGYEPLAADMVRAVLNCEEISKNIDLITAAVGRYREDLYRLYTEGLVKEAGLANIADSTPQSGKDGDPEHQNRQLVFQSEVKGRLMNRSIPLAARTVYAKLGSKCTVASNRYMGTAHYNAALKCINFNLEADLQNPCGVLSTYFHEVGHMIDFQGKAIGHLSDDAAFTAALKADCQNRISALQDRYGFSEAEARWYIHRQLMSNVNLYADVSDIMGGLTNGECQNIWGHSQAYWAKDPGRVAREAFANMYSVMMSDEHRVAAMKEFFPTAYQRFGELLEELL